MEFKQIAIISTLACLIICSINMSSNPGYGIPEIIGAMIASNIPAFVYLLVKRKKEKSGITFTILQNILAILSLIGRSAELAIESS